MTDKGQVEQGSSRARWIALLLAVVLFVGLLVAYSYIYAPKPTDGYTTTQGNVAATATSDTPDCFSVKGYSGTVVRFCLWLVDSGSVQNLYGFFDHGHGTPPTNLPLMTWTPQSTGTERVETPDNTGELEWSGGPVVVIGATNG